MYRNTTDSIPWSCRYLDSWVKWRPWFFHSSPRRCNMDMYQELALCHFTYKELSRVRLHVRALLRISSASCSNQLAMKLSYIYTHTWLQFALNENGKIDCKYYHPNTVHNSNNTFNKTCTFLTVTEQAANRARTLYTANNTSPNTFVWCETAITFCEVQKGEFLVFLRRNITDHRYSAYKCWECSRQKVVANNFAHFTWLWFEWHVADCSADAFFRYPCGTQNIYAQNNSWTKPHTSQACHPGDCSSRFSYLSLIVQLSSFQLTATVRSHVMNQNFTQKGKFCLMLHGYLSSVSGGWPVSRGGVAVIHAEPLSGSHHRVLIWACLYGEHDNIW